MVDSVAFTGAIVGKCGRTIDFVLNVFAHHPEIYRALSRWLPLMRQSGACADSKGWGLYILVAALSQIQPWVREPSPMIDVAWMLATMSTLLAVVALFRRFSQWISDVLNQVSFPSILVILLWPDRSIQPIPNSRSSSQIAGYPDPDRPLKLRI